MGRFDRFWEMRVGGTDPDSQSESFVCKDCGAETAPEAGWNGEPDESRCKGHCRGRQGDWRPGGAGRRYKRNFDAIFPGAPGAGI